MNPALLVLAQEATNTAVQASDSNLALPDFRSVQLMNGQLTAATLFMAGLVVCLVGIGFGLMILNQLRTMPVHRAMKEISELIYETCKAYLSTQVKFILQLAVPVGFVVLLYYWRETHGNFMKVLAIFLFILLGIAGSSGIAWFGIRVNTYANSRSAFASLRGKPFPTFDIPLKAGMSIGMLLICIELFIMLCILLWVPSTYAGACFIGFAVGESLGASVLRIAGGIFTKVADIGSDLMKIVFNIKEDDARNPGVIADCAGDNAGDSVGPSADGFETYGVTAVALITFILLAVGDPRLQGVLIAWIFGISILMILMSAASYGINQVIARARFLNAETMDFEQPLTQLVWLTSLLSIAAVFGASYLLVGSEAGGLWWKLSAIVSCGTIAGAVIPEVIKVFTSTSSRHVREVVQASREGGASLNVLAGLTAGNFSAYWMGIVIAALMGAAYGFSTLGLPGIGVTESAVFAFGLVAFGFLSMGPITIAVDSYGPVTDNAQSVYELSLIEEIPDIATEVKKDFGFDLSFDKAKGYLEANDGAGNTFKATAKPVLIGTAVVGATTMIFSVVLNLAHKYAGGNLQQIGVKFSLLNPPFLLGIILGGAVIYWFSGAATQAVATGAYRAVEFIKNNIKLDGTQKASTEDSKRVVAICTEYAQKGMFNIFLGVFFSALSFAFLDSFLFVGYLISIAIFGLFQALFMANAGGAWDNAKKVVEVELKAKGTPLHAASVVGDTVGDPFKDTSSVALNPVIKFTSLFGLLAVQLAESLPEEYQSYRMVIAIIFYVPAAAFVYRSFYGMRIDSKPAADVTPATAKAL